ncbi:MAG TPA: endonuclease, partial [Actinopolymorphaceae bacterium]
MSRCLAPCVGQVDVETYAHTVAAVRQAIERDPGPVIDAVVSRIRTLADQERYEEAAAHRDRMAAFVRAAARTQRVAALARCREVVAARRTDEGGWETHVVRHGRLAAAGVVPPGVPPRAAIDVIVQGAETVTAPPPPTPGATVEETEKVLSWLSQPGVRLVEIDGEWSCPVAGAGARTDWLEQAYAADVDAPSEDRRGLRTTHRPPR